MTGPSDLQGATGAKVIACPTPKPRLRAGVPPFDPTNPAHLRAWEAIWDFAQRELKGDYRHE
jgi:hypothetical protein